MRLLRTVSSADSSALVGTTNFKKVYWLNPANSGDTVVIQDASANTVLSLRCESANVSQVFDFSTDPLGPLNGHKVSTIASGTLYIYG